MKVNTILITPFFKEKLSFTARNSSDSARIIHDYAFREPCCNNGFGLIFIGFSLIFIDFSLVFYKLS